MNYLSKRVNNPESYNLIGSPSDSESDSKYHSHSSSKLIHEHKKPTLPIHKELESDRETKPDKYYQAVDPMAYDPLDLDRQLSQGEFTDEGYEHDSDGSEGGRWKSTDDFGDHYSMALREAKTGRHRRKIAARTKGGEFQASRRKRRAYFCCMGSEIDIQKLHDHLHADRGWSLKLYGDVLRLFRDGLEPTTPVLNPHSSYKRHSQEMAGAASDGDEPRRSATISKYIDHHEPRRASLGHMSTTGAVGLEMTTTHSMTVQDKLRSVSKQFISGPQEVYIFEYGSAVFWGFRKGEETPLLDLIREFVTKGILSEEEFENGEDDMGFVMSSEAKVIQIANDVMTMPESTVEQQRLAVSYAICQSTILAIFEARVERKVEEYKYIPETLARNGQIHLPHRKIGRMIGEVFVVRHDVNLHSDILDTPDFFWKEDQYEPQYRMVMRYLEMSERVEVLNKRLDMLKELLDVLQQQMDSAHATKLEWIVIWLIVIEIAIEVIGIAGEVFGIWKIF